MRLLGKVYGKNKDLWVCEMEESTDPKEDFDLNKYTYFVNDNPTNEWTRLPDIQPHHVTQAKNIKHLLSGDMNKRLVTNPEFDGREKEFLRAQIARIVHSTTVCPEGLFDKDDENTTGGIVAKEDEAKEIKSNAELNSLEQWVWLRPCFLPSGNLKAKEIEENEDEDGKEKKDEVRETTVERLLKLENDKDSWKVELKGLQDIHKIEGKDVCYGVNVVSSLRWPGSMTL